MFKSLCWLLTFCSVSHHCLTDNKASWLQGDTFKGLLDHPSGTYFSLVLNKWMFIRPVKQIGFSSLANFQFYIAFIPWIFCNLSEIWRKMFMTGCQAQLWRDCEEMGWFRVAAEGEGQESCDFHAKPVPGSREIRNRDRQSWSWWKSS